MSWPIGRRRTTEEKRIISNALKGRMPKNLQLLNLNKRGKGNPMWGRTTSEKQKLAVKLLMSGSNHPHWKGGKETERVRKLISENKRRAQRNAGGVFSHEEWKKLKQAYDSICPSCFRREPEVKLTIDHVIPLSLGGRNTIDNIQPLCKSCNSAKRNFHSKRYLLPKSLINTP